MAALSPSSPTLMRRLVRLLLDFRSSNTGMPAGWGDGCLQTPTLPSLLGLKRARGHAEGCGVLAFPPRKLVRRLLRPLLGLPLKRRRHASRLR